MVRYMRRIYQGWLILISAALVVQLYLAGYGVFAFKGLPPFDPHRALAGWLHLAFLIAVGLAFAARVPWRFTGISFGLFVLMTMQYGLAFSSVRSIAALHVVNGVLIFVITLYLTWKMVRLPSPATAPAGAPASAITR